MKKYKVYRDTSEKLGWWFQSSDVCEGTEEFNLFTGDYTIEGFQEKLIIERKANTAELAKNIYEDRFEEELKRMDSFKYPFLIFEFDMEDVLGFPVNSGIPQRLWPKLKTTPELLLSKILSYDMRYKTKILFAGQNGMRVAEEIFLKVFNKYGKL